MTITETQRQNLELGKQQPKWKNQPTVAIRIPQQFAAELLAIAEKMDKGEWAGASIEQLGAILDRMIFVKR